MKEKIKKWLKSVLFTAGGALVGLAYYYFVGCPTGACPLTSNPFITMVYMGFIGWLLSGIFGKGCSGSCNTQQLIARFKRSHWDFQQEFRYIVILQRARNNIPLKPYYDADLDDAAISNMRIVVSPMFSDSNYLLLDALLKKYDYGIKPSDSALKGKIKLKQ